MSGCTSIEVKAGLDQNKKAIVILRAVTAPGEGVDIYLDPQGATRLSASLIAGRDSSMALEAQEAIEVERAKAKEEK